MEVFDSYDHAVPNCFYIVTRIEGPEAPGELNDVFSAGCQCADFNCVFPTCSCLQSGDNYHFFSDRRRIVQSCLNSYRGPVIECNDNCLCLIKGSSNDETSEFGIPISSSNMCVNRCVQFGPLSTLNIFCTSDKGFGLRSTTDIASGQFICEYAGEVISVNEGKRRRRLNHAKGDMNFVFTLSEYYGNRTHVTCIDPSIFGNIGRYINHSCEPNSAVVPVRIACPVPHLCIFAVKDIAANQEITFDYSIGAEEEISSGKMCVCGSINCRGFLPAGL